MRSATTLGPRPQTLDPWINQPPPTKPTLLENNNMQTTTTTQTIRQRHGLAGDAPVGVCCLPAQIRPDRQDDHTFSALISTSAVDREDEVLLPAGMIASDFEKAGAIFWNHDYDEPIGFAGRLRRTEQGIEAAGNTFMKRPPDFEG